jgi:methionyl-tRNA formyltransferase
MYKIVFFGSSEFSIPILEQLKSLPDFQISAVVSKADKPVGRNQIITSNPVSAYAKKNQLNLLQPSEFDSDFTKTFRSINPDLALVVAYGPPYFTQELIDIPKYKVVNIHPSPLPKYRGATPGPWQIINGETKSAVTFFQIDALPDHGPIITQIPFEISKNETAQSFYNKAFSLAAFNLESVLKSYIETPKKLEIQNHSQKSYFPKFNKDNAQIDWSWDSKKIERFIRALNPWPIAWTNLTDQQGNQLKMKIFSASLNSNLTDLILDEVQIEGKKPTKWSEIEKYYSLKRE